MKIVARQPLWSVLVVLALGPGSVTWPQQAPATTRSSVKSLVTIPADVAGDGFIFLRARVNNSQPMWFALDSGASLPFVIDVRRAKELGLKLRGHLTREGGAGPGTYEAALTSGVSINLAALKFANQTAIVMALDSIEAQVGRTLDGLVGMDLFTRYVVEIDYFGN